MAHMIDMSNNRNNIAFVGEVPWHGLGSQVAPKTPVDVWMKEAGLDWTAERTKALFKPEGQDIIASPFDLLYRSDTNETLGIVTPRYKIVQPKEVLEFYSDLVAVEGWDIEVAGSLDGGKRIWALAKTDASINVLGSVDRLETYLLLATSYDGTMATIGKFTSVRVVCQNTMTMSLGMDEGMAKVKIPHSRTFNAQAMKEELNIYAKATQVMEEEANVLAKRKVSDSEAVRFLIDVLAGKDVPAEDLSTRASNIITGVFDLYKGKGMGSTLKSAEGTAWGLLSAVTEHTDHHVGRNNNNRIRNGWFGGGETLKLQAKELLLSVA